MNQKFNIFIDGPSVYLKKGKNAGSLVEVEIQLELYIMLVVLLRYKSRSVPSRELFLRVTRQRETKSDLMYIKQNCLRFLKQDLKKLLSTVPGVVLPRKTSDKGYRCTGDFPYCVIVSKNAASEFEVDLRITEIEPEANASLQA